MTNSPAKKLSKIQNRNRSLILEAALEVFSNHGFRGATLDQIAEAAGMSKPNILYYFSGKEDIHLTLLNQLMDAWLSPLEQLNETGDPLSELLGYVKRKLEMSRQFPRESRLFANELLQGAPHMRAQLETGLKPLFDEKVLLIERWIKSGKIAAVDPRHLFFSIWATTQTYADFEAQISVLIPGPTHPDAEADRFLLTMFERTLKL